MKNKPNSKKEFFTHPIFVQNNIVQKKNLAAKMLAPSHEFYLLNLKIYSKTWNV